MFIRAAIVIASLAAVVGVGAARAQEPYYKGKTIALYAGFTPGGGIDGEMRLIARFLGRHIAGNPNVQAQNMPGAGGILLANHLYSASRPDGLEIGMPGRSGFVLAAAVGDASARYDLRKFTWIGGAGANNLILWLRKGLGVSTLEDLRARKGEVVIGGLAASSASVVTPLALAKYERLPLRVISGYTGLSVATLAMERGEIDGIYTHAGTFRPDLIASGAIVPVLQTFAVEPNLPALENIDDAKEKALLDLLIAPGKVGAPVLGPPGLPAEATAALRRGYLEMAASAEYRAEAAKQGIDIGEALEGSQLQAYVAAHLGSIPADVVTEYQAFSGIK